MNRCLTFLCLLSVLFSGCACHCNAPLLECPSINKYDYIVYHKGYTLSFNQVTHSSDWVAYELTKEELDGNWPRSNDFRADPDIQDYQAEYKDYKGSGWHRGHLAPAGDMKWDSVAMSESFYYTNICPQTERLNQGVWQSLENKVRKWTKQYGNLYICCGPIFTTNQNGTFGQNNVMVPDYYYKALLVSNSGTISAIAFMMKNDNENQCLENCACTIDELERVIGRDLFCSLDNSLERRIEAVIVWDDWGLTEPK